MKLTNSTELSQQLCPHAQDHVHGGLRQEVLLTEGPLPALTAGLLPRLTTHSTYMQQNSFLAFILINQFMASASIYST